MRMSEWEKVTVGDVAEKIAVGLLGSNIKKSIFVKSDVPSITQPSSFLKTIEIPLTSLEEQSKIVSTLYSISKKIELNTLENRTLCKLRDTLLLKLMYGELDVSEVEV
jgi:restriction endonuclease S subunit